MSNPYPSRRELRQQRQRQERAKLRDQEARRWADEVQQRQQRADETERQATEAVANATPVPASDATNPSDPVPPTHGRRAAASPVDASTDDDVAAQSQADAQTQEDLPLSRRRRADSQVTSTGMLPIITKRDEQESVKPGSRREAREMAARKAAERRAEIEALEAQQQAAAEPETPPRAVRRADSPAAPPPTPAVVDVPIDPQTGDDAVKVTTSSQFNESATEITDMSGLDTIEIHRAELRAETERLTQEIVELGQANPNVIDPKLLQRQKELAEKSQELQELETDAVSIVEDPEDDVPEAIDEPEIADEAQVIDEPYASDIDDPAASEADTGMLDTEPALKLPKPALEDDAPAEDLTQPVRQARRATTGPPISGPFEVVEGQDAETAALPGETKPDFSTHLELDDGPQTGPDQPLEASSAHGLDTLDPKESEAPERRILLLSTTVFAIGIGALLIAIILLTR